jgi:hypothetical protein
MSNKKWAWARLAANNFPINKAAVSRRRSGPLLPGRGSPGKSKAMNLL